MARQKVSPADVGTAARTRSAIRKNADTKAAQDIGKPPKIVDRSRRDSCEFDFERFCKVFLLKAFPKPFSPDHQKAIAKIQKSVLTGGLFALAMPRGSGKTTLILAAILWAVLYAHHRFVCLIAASSGRAELLLSNIKTWLETNELLAADFPEICHPIEKLNRSAHRAKQQHIDGEFTRIEWGASVIVFPTVKGAKNSGAIISTAGLDSSDIRGQQRVREGEIIRPTFMAVDDAQTRESAKSITQCESREATLSGDVLGMAGPGETISGFLLGTVIRKGDFVDRMLDRKLHPQWSGERLRMVYKWPDTETSKKHLDIYNQLRLDDFEAGGDGASATDYWRTHRLEIEEGAEVAWSERFEPLEVSALQHAWNLRLRDPLAFASEYQNDPIVDENTAAGLTAGEVSKKLSGIERGVVPQFCTKLTAFVDLHDEIFYWKLCAFSETFSGGPIDYGTLPRQTVQYFSQRSPPITLSSLYPDHGFEAKILAGLKSVTDMLMTGEWRRPDGVAMQVDLCLIDANWGDSTEIVYAFIANSPHKARLRPSHGIGKGASGKPLNETKKAPGERRGLKWYEKKNPNRPCRHVGFDSNFYKSFAVKRLRTALGGVGSISLFGSDPKQHRLIADHYAAEYPIRTETEELTVDEWKQLLGRDNHWFDGLVGCCVGASMEGCKVPDSTVIENQERRVFTKDDVKKLIDKRKSSIWH